MRNLRACGIGDKAYVKKNRRNARLNQAVQGAGVKQLIIEFLAYIVSSGLLLNLWLMQKLIQKITDFESINQRLQKKFQALEKLLNNIE